MEYYINFKKMCPLKKYFDIYPGYLKIGLHKYLRAILLAADSRKIRLTEGNAKRRHLKN
jgi:hypothetical protein